MKEYHKTWISKKDKFFLGKCVLLGKCGRWFTQYKGLIKCILMYPSVYYGCPVTI